MGGDALVVDTGAIAEWLNEMPPPIARSLSADEQPSAARGATVFNAPATGCATCHSGALYTDRMFHSVLPASTDPDAQLSAVDTPSLIAVRNRPPYLHDGSAPTLMDVLTTQNVGDTHGQTSTLSAQQLQDLETFLESL